MTITEWPTRYLPPSWEVFIRELLSIHSALYPLNCLHTSTVTAFSTEAIRSVFFMWKGQHYLIPKRLNGLIASGSQNNYHCSVPDIRCTVAVRLGFGQENNFVRSRKTFSVVLCCVKFSFPQWSKACVLMHVLKCLMSMPLSALLNESNHSQD